MAEVFAGFVCGFALSIIATPPFALWVLHSRDDIPFIRNAVPKGLGVTLLSVPIASLFFFVWTGLGLVLGMLLLAADNGNPTDAFGSPNVAFSVIVVISALMIFMPFFVLVRSARRLALFLIISYILLFGWATPILAHYASTRVS
jgi:hypothetical protein